MTLEETMGKLGGYKGRTNKERKPGSGSSLVGEGENVGERKPRGEAR